MLVFATFLLTMIFLMFKSRFTKVGMDGSGQFEPIYMRILAQHIADSIPLNMNYAEQFYVNSERIIQVENVAIKVCLSEDDFKRIKSEERIAKEDAQAWISRCVVGKIDKKELDDERKNETNALDYMQNTSIVYHTESILEA